MKYNIGIDLGGTNIAAGVVTPTGEILKKCSRPTDTSSAEAVVLGMASVASELMQACGLSNDDIGTLGVACPGIVNAERGVVERSANLPLTDFNVRNALASATGLPRDKIRMANDADAAALGEVMAGVGRGACGFLMITIGTGIGGSYIHDGVILTGFNHAGGEFGHTVIVADGEPCGCGRRGCAEKYCSAKALVRLTQEKLDECERLGVHTIMTEMVRDYGKVSGRTSFRAADAGDKAGQEVVDRYISYLACMTANFINIFQPEVLAIGGGISNEGERLLAPLREYVEREIYNKHQPQGLRTQIKRAELGGDAGIVGAAGL